MVPKSEGFDKLRIREFQFYSNRGKSETKGKDEKRDKSISHISYKLPLIFFIVSLILLYKTLMEKNYEKRCQSKRVTWNNLNLPLLGMRIHAKVNIKSSSIYKKLADSAKKH